MGCKTGTTARRAHAAYITCLLALLCLPQARAQDPANAPPGDFMIEAVVTGVNPATGRDGSTFSVKAYVGGERTRIDLGMPEADNAYIIVDNETGLGWVISKDRDAALPVSTDSYRELVVDPQAPCARMQARCEPLGYRGVAGVRAQGTRYAGARGRGSGGSDRGDMWVDPDSGLVVSYDGRTRDRKTRRMRATQVRREALPGALFELPAPLRPR